MKQGIWRLGGRVLILRAAQEVCASQPGFGYQNVEPSTSSSQACLTTTTFPRLLKESFSDRRHPIVANGVGSVDKRWLSTGGRNGGNLKAAAKYAHLLRRGCCRLIE